MKNILYILDDKLNLRSFVGYLKAIKRNAGQRIYLCPVTTDSNFVSSIEKVISKYGEVEILDFVKKFHENAFLYKNKFIRFLSDFSRGEIDAGIDLRKYFSYPFGRFSLWWLSLIREISPYKTQSYHYLAKLITIIDFEHDYRIDEVYVDIRTDELKKAILRNSGRRRVTIRKKPKNNATVKRSTAIVKTAGFIAFLAAKKCILWAISGWDMKRRLSLLENTKYLFATYFPFADKGLLKKNIFKNEYSGNLQVSAEKNYKGRVSHLCVLHTNSRLKMDEIKLAVKINKWGHNLFMPEELISFRQIAGVAFVFFYTCLKYLLKLPYLKHNFVFDYKRKINIWDIYSSEWDYSFCGTYIAGNLRYYYVFSNMMGKITDNTVVIYPAELYGWENALNIAKRKFKHIRTVGIQHASFPLLMLTYFNTQKDLADSDSLTGFPMPSYLGSSGNIPKNLFVESGWPKEKVFDVGAIRYHNLAKYLQGEINWTARKKRVVVALTSVEEENREVLSMLRQAFDNKNICSFVIRPHPLCPMRDVIGSIGFDFKGGKFTLDSDTPLEDLLVSSRAVIVAGSTVSIDGVACQCPVIIPRLSGVADMNPLSGVSKGLARYVSTKDELDEAVSSIVNSGASPVDFNNFKTFVNNYFTITDNEEDYFARLEKELS